MIPKQSYSLAVLALLALTTAGCSTQASNRCVIKAEGNADITIRNSALHEECEIVGGRSFYEGDIMLGLVTLRSHEDEKQTLEYRWTWLDSDLVEMQGGNRSWQTVFVNAREEPQVQGRANEPGAVQGMFELRYHSGVTGADN